MQWLALNNSFRFEFTQIFGLLQCLFSFYLFFWIYLLLSFLNFSSYFLFLIYFFMHEPSCEIVCSCNFVPSCIFDSSLVKNKTRSRLTLVQNWPFVHNCLLMQKWPFVQVYFCAILCTRAVLFPRAFLTVTQLTGLSSFEFMHKHF